MEVVLNGKEAKAYKYKTLGGTVLINMINEINNVNCWQTKTDNMSGCWMPYIDPQHVHGD